MNIDKYNLGKNREEELLSIKKRAKFIKTKNIEKLNEFGIYGNLLANLSNTVLRTMIEELQNESNRAIERL